MANKSCTCVSTFGGFSRSYFNFLDNVYFTKVDAKVIMRAIWTTLIGFDNFSVIKQLI